MDPRIEIAAAEFVLLRRMKMRAKAARRAAFIQCDGFGDEGDPDIGYGGGPCVLNREAVGSDICEHCRASDVAHKEFTSLSRQTASALRKLDRTVAGAGYPVGE